MKQVTIVLPNGYVDLSSISGSYEILKRANEFWCDTGNKSLLEIQIAGCAKELRSDVGFFSINPLHIQEIKKTDLLIVPGISKYYDSIIKNNKELISWIREQYMAGAEIASICTGAFLLAATGLLDGKICSTHWGAADDFRRLFPDVQLQSNNLITSQNGIYTNGGSYSFLNLLIFLVEKYFDRRTAIFCSKMFQIDIDRSSQSPYVIFQTQKNHGDELISQAQTYIEKNMSEKISFEDLATQLATSRRNFDRRFFNATGNTPVEYLQRVKVEVAKRSFEKGRKSVFEVMTEVGYSDDKAFREVFKKLTGLTPMDYRTKYNKQVVEPYTN